MAEGAGRRAQGKQVDAFVAKGLLYNFFPTGQVEDGAFGMLMDICIPVIFICFGVVLDNRHDY